MANRKKNTNDMIEVKNEEQSDVKNINENAYDTNEKEIVNDNDFMDNDVSGTDNLNNDIVQEKKDLKETNETVEDLKNNTDDKKVKQNFKNIFRYKNGKPVKYVEDKKFKEDMNNIAKKRGYYEDMFKSNLY